MSTLLGLIWPVGNGKVGVVTTHSNRTVVQVGKPFAKRNRYKVVRTDNGTVRYLPSILSQDRQEYTLADAQANGILPDTVRAYTDVDALHTWLKAVVFGDGADGDIDWSPEVEEL